MRSFVWADTWLALGAPLLVMITGVAMVMINDAWSFEQAWILGSIGLVIGYEVIAMMVGARLYRQIEDARAQGRVESAGHAGTMRAWGRLGAVLLAMLVAIVGLMVLKPGI
jgi:uncharacterized membrane protein